MVNSKTANVRRCWSWFQTINRYLFPVMTFAGAVALLGTMLLTVVDVMGRYLFGTPVLGSNELIGLMLLVSVMVMLPLLVLADDQIRVDLFTHAIRPSFAKWVQRIYSVALGVGCAWLAMSVLKLAARADRKALVTEYLEIPASWAMYVVALSLLLCAFAFLIRSVCPEKELGCHIQAIEADRHD